MNKEKKELQCFICGITSKTKTIKWVSSQNCYLCQKHKAQIYRHGKITDVSSLTTADKNEIIIYENYAEIVIRNKKQEIKAKTIIDVDDVERCKQIKWYLDNKGYVHGKNKITLHRFIMNYYGKNVIDHINRNKLDNRKGNLRITSSFVNNQNNGADGVYFDKRANVWRSEFNRYGKYFYVGIFKTKEEAIKARTAKIQEVDRNKENLLLAYREKDKTHTTGVNPSPHGKWVAKFCADGRTYHVGTFNTKEEAIMARQNAIQEYKLKISA